MDQSRIDQYHTLFEQMVRCMTDTEHFDRVDFVQVLRDLSVLFRLSKGVTEYYRSERAEKAGEGEKMIDYDTGQKDHPVLRRRMVFKSQSIIVSTLYMTDDEAPLTDEEREKLDLILLALTTFVGRNRLETTLEKLGYYDDDEYPNLRFYLRFIESLILDDRLREYTALCLNIRHFSGINQEIGRKAADLVLRNYISTLSTAVGDEGTVCRIGGDNFVMIFKKELTQQILHMLSGIPVVCDPETNKRVLVSASAGVYDIPGDAVPVEAGQVMDHIYSAMMTAKQNSEIPVVYYDQKMISMRDNLARIHLLFPKAVENNEFRVFYQPKVDVKTGRIVGAEALCRWFRDGKIVPPMDFIPALEQNSEICTLDFHMLDLVCRDIRRWLDERKPLVRISVNLSRKHLVDMDLVQHLLDIIDSNNVPHDCIEIELTETATEVGFKALKKLSFELQDNGFYTSVDDFGMGYSSLNLIREISWNVLKIDRCFLPTDDEPDDSVTSLMFRHVISMAQDLGLECVTEGVETKKQLELLKRNHCHIAQGYFFDKPLSVEEYENRLSRGYYDI